jgi:hypothetical protein
VGVAEGRVQPLTVVEHLDVLDGVGLHRLVGGEAFPEDPLVLEAIEPALGWGVVPTVALAAHRAEHAILGQLPLKGMAGVLATAIGMMDQAWGWFTAKARHAQRIDNEIGAHPWLERPAHHFAVEQIKHDHQIQPAFIAPEGQVISEVQT